MRLAIVSCCIALSACRAAAIKNAVSAPIGTRVAVALTDSLEDEQPEVKPRATLTILDVGSRTTTRTTLKRETPRAVSWASGGASYFFMLTDAQLVGWTGLSTLPDRQFALNGFVPSGVVGGDDAALVFSREVSTTSKLALWRPDGSEIKRVNAFDASTRVTACVCDLGDGRWLAVGAGTAQGESDALVIVDRDGLVRATFDMLDIIEDVRGAAGCAVDSTGTTVAIVFSASANALMLRRDGDNLQRTAVLPLPAGMTFAERLTPVLISGGAALVVPARTGEDLAFVPTDGSPAGRIRSSFAGIPRAIARLPGSDALLIGLVGETAQLVLHFFNGSEDISLFDLGVAGDLVDLIVAAPQG